MNIRYVLPEQMYSYHISKKDSTHSVLLSNNKGDFFHQGINGPTTKFHGFTYCDSKTLDMFKIIDDFTLNTNDIDTIDIKGYEIQREFKEKKNSHFSYPVKEENRRDDLFGDEGKLSYNSQGQLQEELSTPQLSKPKDSIYLGPTGGIIYNVENYSGKFTLDLDMRKHDDFDTLGRLYSVYKKNSTLFVKYVKEKDGKTDYTLFFGIHLPIDDYILKQEWTKKEYEYSKQRNSLYEWYVYRLMEIEITSPLTMFMASGKTEKEVEDQLFLLQHHESELKGFDEVMQKELLKEQQFSKPLSQDVHVAYNQSKLAMYKLLSKDLEGPLKSGSFAGLPWFHQVWSRDELVSLRGYLELGDYSHIVEKIYDYLAEIDEETGLLPRLHKKGTLESFDGVFWLAKRIEDLLFHLDERGELTKIISQGELEYIYSKLSKSFSTIIKQNWDNEKELLHSKPGDSWMDTLSLEYSFDIQVQLLGFISTLGVIAGILNKKEDEEHYVELEILLRDKIAEVYYRVGKLYDDFNEPIFNANVFLGYYFYPELFPSKTWESIIDKALKEMKLSWGGISSLSKFDTNYRDTYSGEDNLSYHRGDSWYWINNISAIVLHDLNERKYRDVISSILLASTRDILQQGTFGFGSEISSAKAQESRGCLAQLWSSSTYLELVHHLFGKEHL